MQEVDITIQGPLVTLWAYIDRALRISNVDAGNRV